MIGADALDASVRGRPREEPGRRRVRAPMAIHLAPARTGPRTGPRTGSGTVLPALALLAAAAAAQRPAAPQEPAAAAAPEVIRNPAAESIRTGKEGFVLPKGPFELRDLIDEAATFLQWNILYTEEELQHAGRTPFVFQKELALDALGCEEALCRLLGTRGCALTTIDAEKRLYEVVFIQGPRRNEITSRAVLRTPEEILRRPDLHAPVITHLQLEHTNANIAVNALRPFLAQSHNQAMSGVMIGTAGNNSNVVLTGFQDEVARVVQILQRCDTEQPVPAEMEQRLVQIEQALARLSEAVKTLQDKAKQTDSR